MSEKEPTQGQVLIYHDGATRLQVRLDGATAWLTQAAMAELFQTSTQKKLAGLGWHELGPRRILLPQLSRSAPESTAP